MSPVIDEWRICLTAFSPRTFRLVKAGKPRVELITLTTNGYVPFAGDPVPGFTRVTHVHPVTGSSRVTWSESRNVSEGQSSCAQTHRQPFLHTSSPSETGTSTSRKEIKPSLSCQPELLCFHRLNVSHFNRINTCVSCFKALTSFLFHTSNFVISRHLPVLLLHLCIHYPCVDFLITLLFYLKLARNNRWSIY